MLLGGAHHRAAADGMVAVAHPAADTGRRVHPAPEAAAWQCAVFLHPAVPAAATGLPAALQVAGSNNK
jgi:hypothetical protein